jgi:hypothetical protein
VIDDERFVRVASEQNLPCGSRVLIFGMASAKNSRRRPHCRLDKRRKFLIEKVLPPLSIRSSDHPHDVPAGMQGEGPWLLKQFHISFSQQPVPFAAVAGMAAGNQIFPRG